MRSRGSYAAAPRSRLRLVGRGLWGLLTIYVLLCVALFFLQRTFIYHPVPRDPAVPSMTLGRTGARVVVSIRTTGRDHRSQAVLYFGGNGEDVSRSLDPLGQAFPDAAIYAMHYRGYGGSAGHPSEVALVTDATALFDVAALQYPRIVLVGRSLGSGVAIQVAAQRRAERLVLVTPFNSLTDIAAGRLPVIPVRWLLEDRYESWRFAPRLTTPTTLVIAADDRLIPPANSYRLARAFPPGVAKVIVIPGAGHNDVANFPGYVPALTGHDSPPAGN